jgi:hypothetical protein
MVVDERKCKELMITNIDGRTTNVRVRPSDGSYTRSFGITINPTDNCQLASANSIGPSIKSLNKYHLRDLFINLKQHISKRILLLDLNRQFVQHLLDCIPESAVLVKNDYTSTNGHSMTILLIRLSSIRQLQLPKTK